jgi:dTDP-4-dehydrorhamnose 3,5-epimerase
VTRFTRLAIDGVVRVEPGVFRDARGYFLETYNAVPYREHGIPETFVQDNQSHSQAGVLRGLHAQRRRPQGKLVRCVQGEIWDVAVDIRPRSATFGRWVAESLSEDNFHQLWVPPGFAHGFCVLRGPAIVEYKCSDYYDRQDEIGVVWNDPGLAIDWPLRDPLVSDKDRALPRLEALETLP